jgi:hypothetical protein
VPLRYVFPLISDDGIMYCSLLKLAVQKLAHEHPSELGRCIANMGFNGEMFVNFKDTTDQTRWKEDKYPNWGDRLRLPNPLKLFTNVQDGSIYKIPNVYYDQTNPSSFAHSCYGAEVPPPLDAHTSPKDCNGFSINYESWAQGDRFSRQWALLNVEEWDRYIHENTQQANHARFILCRVLDIPVDVYIEEDEEVWLTTGGDDKVEVCDEVKNLTPQQKKYAIQVVRHQSSNDITLGLDGDVEVAGNFGVCNSKKYKTVRTFRGWLLWVILAGIILTMILVIILIFKPRGRTTPVAPTVA